MKPIHLIRKMSRENATWGAPLIANELALLGHDVGETTVAKYMVKRTPSERKRQSWRAFLRNQMGEAAACDFFTLPSLTFNVLYVFVVLSHDRRRFVHVNVTTNPTAQWTANQIREAFPGGEEPRFLHRDRDSIYGDTFGRAIRSMGIKQVISAKKSPWQNPFVERVIGSIRRECTDHIIPLNERHLLRVLKEYVAWYNKSRPHLSLDGNAPERRAIEHGGRLVTTPVLGGPHHRYHRAA